VTYRIEIARDAVRALGKLDKPVRHRIQYAIYQQLVVLVIDLGHRREIYRDL
jgi:mRNA-degrading endonuclease RelE of RelBE toxin-antitoxin system